MLQSFSLKKASDRGVVQLVESRSPKPLVLGSSPSAPAKTPARKCGSFAFDRGRGLELRFPVGNGFSDGKNEANRLALGIKPRTTLKAVFGRVARNTPPGRFGACLPSAPAKESESNRFRIFYFGGARTRTLFPDGKRVLRRQKRSKSPRPWRKAADDAQSRFWAHRPKHLTGVFRTRLPSAPAKSPLLR